ncbi:MAG: hypothetical protein IPM70_12855 [Proteobacteria bacterium]|nr:hypothetical protein [Pseudomonadota bacterium]
MRLLRSASLTPRRLKGSGRVGIGCVGEVTSPGTSLCGTGRWTMATRATPLTRSNTYVSPALNCATAGMRLPFTVMSSSTGAAGVS